MKYAFGAYKMENMLQLQLYPWKEIKRISLNIIYIIFLFYFYSCTPILEKQIHRRKQICLIDVAKYLYY